MTARRTALLVVLPEADEILDDFRKRHDPALARGIPAHVTVLFRFAEVPAIDDALLSSAQATYAGVEPSDVRLTRVERFPAHVWLAPEPRARFVQLTKLATACFPDYPPYEGAFAETVPHLTIGSGDDVDAIAAAAETELAPLLPLRSRASAVALLEEQADGRWAERCSFPLGRP